MTLTNLGPCYATWVPVCDPADRASCGKRNKMAACVSRGSPGISFACSSVKWLSNLKMLSVINMRMPKSSFSSSVSDKITVNGLDLHYEKAGSHSHVVLCMPGALGSTQSDFGPQLTGLSDRFTVVAFDPRGYGKSRPPERDFPSDFFVRDAWDAAELMRKLGEYPSGVCICFTKKE